MLGINNDSHHELINQAFSMMAFIAVERILQQGGKPTAIAKRSVNVRMQCAV